MEPIRNADQRRYLRYEIFDYASIKTDESTEEQHGMIVDIGLGGLQLRSRTELPIGSVVTLTVGRLEDKPLVMRTEVRHCSKVEGTDLFALGMRFSPVGHTQRLETAEFVHQVFVRQREQLTR